MVERKQNRLAKEKSPYLLQHQYNPVDWYPWGEEAFERAKKEDKPIFLSIGYSTCHWCHVMEEESFSDDEVAAALNRVFVCIKVDREERPDIDAVYMEVCQRTAGNCGWPLNVLMTPGKKPFFITTYIPKENKFGLEGIIELAEKTEELWKDKDQRKELMTDAESIIKKIEEAPQGSKGLPLDNITLKTTYDHLMRIYDNKNKGFGYAPKFPSPHNLSYLLRYWKRYSDKNALTMVEDTLTAMRMGGIFDQVGFGFHRYSTDEKWLVPHFEKMLYDQALIAIACIETYQATKDQRYKRIADEIFEFVLRDMTSEDGAFYSAIDADSEGEEGKFYLWTYDEITGALGKDADNFIKAFNILEDGNFTEKGMHESKHRTPKNILYLTRLTDAKDAALERSRKKLFELRSKRVHPSIDDKILTDMNGLMIVAFARAAQAFDDKRYLEAARRAARFVLDRLSAPNGRLYHRYRKGNAEIPAFLDDYAFSIQALIELYEATFETDYLKLAISLNQIVTERFWDGKNYGFFLQASDSEELILRKKDAHDGAIPSGNSFELLNLLKLTHFTGDQKLEEYAFRLESAFSNEVARAPGSFAQFMVGADFRIGPSYEIIIVEGGNREMSEKMKRRLYDSFLPNKVVMLKSKESTPIITKIADYTKFLEAMEGKTTACVCARYSCKMPATDTEQMMERLKI